MKNIRARRGYALFSVLFLAFLLVALLGAAVIHIGYSHDVVTSYLRRAEARGELTSMTNMSLKWLASRLESERPRASGAAPDIDASKYLTSAELLRIFSASGENGGQVEVYDLDYDLGSLAEPAGDLLLFPASLPGGYMIRAVVVKNEMFPFIMESVYAAAPIASPAGGAVYVLEEKPLYRRELFRQTQE